MPAIVVTVPEVPSRCAGPPSQLIAEPVLGFERREHPLHRRDHRFEALGRDVAAVEIFSERDDADRQRCPRDDGGVCIDAALPAAAARAGTRQVEPDDFR